MSTAQRIAQRAVTRAWAIIDKAGCPSHMNRLRCRRAAGHRGDHVDQHGETWTTDVTTSMSTLKMNVVPDPAVLLKQAQRAVGGGGGGNYTGGDQ